jgi:hypothetical protein
MGETSCQPAEPMSRAVLAIDPAAWAGKSVVEGAIEPTDIPGRVGTVRGHRRAVGVPSHDEKPKKKPRHRDDGDGALGDPYGT